MFRCLQQKYDNIISIPLSQLPRSIIPLTVLHAIACHLHLVSYFARRLFLSSIRALVIRILSSFPFPFRLHVFRIISTAVLRSHMSWAAGSCQFNLDNVGLSVTREVMTLTNASGVFPT